MNFNNVIQVKLGGDTEVDLIKLGNSVIVYKRILYIPYEFQNKAELTEVMTMVNKEHTDLSFMFSGCESLVSVNTQNWDTSNVTTMNSMFSLCKSLTSLDISNFDTSQVTSMGFMFSRCHNLTSLDLSNFDTSQVTSMTMMFFECWNLEILDIRNFDMSKIIGDTSTSRMFENCINLHTLKLNNCSNDTIYKILASLKFSDDGEIRKIYCREANAIGLAAPNGWEFAFIPIYVHDEFKYNDEITEVEVIVNDTHTDLSSMFYFCGNLTKINTQDWDTSNVTDMYGMFNGCIKLQELDVSKFDTSQVTTMESMFGNCYRLKSLNVRNFNTSKVTSMTRMFYNIQLESLDLSNWNVSSVKSLKKMFEDCSSLKTLNLSNWHLNEDVYPYVETLEMFENCKSLESINLTGCDYYTITVINGPYTHIPTGTVGGKTRKMYHDCEEVNEKLASGDIIAPDGWEFVYVN